MMQARVIETPSFQQAYRQLSPRIQKIVDNKIEQLLKNQAHPSLQAHRLRQARAKGVWICYISITKRLLYQYKDSAIYLLDVGEHCVVERIHQRRFE